MDTEILSIVRKAKAEAYETLGQEDQAVNEWQRSAEALFASAARAYQGKNWREALRQFQKLCEIDARWGMLSKSAAP